MLFFDGTKGDIEVTVRMLKHKAEVKGMILTEYNEEEVMNGFKEEARDEKKIAFIKIYYHWVFQTILFKRPQK